MARVSASTVRIQPHPEPVQNSFALMGNEKFLYDWEAELGCCWFKKHYFSTLTDTRLLLREEISSGCCCCVKQIPLDSSIFLRDIVQMEEVSSNHPVDSSACTGCCDSFSDTMKCLELKGAFGTEKVYGTSEDIKLAQIEIPAATGNHKLVIHNPFWTK